MQCCFWDLQCTLLSPFFCIKTGLLFVAFMYLPSLMTKWNKDSFVSTLHFPVAIKPDNIRTHGEGMRWGFSEPISDCTVWICVYCNDCTCPANCWNTVFPVEPRQLWTEPCSVSHYISISSSKIRFRLSVEQESDFLIKRYLVMDADVRFNLVVFFFFYLRMSSVTFLNISWPPLLIMKKALPWKPQRQVNSARCCQR